MSTKPEQLFEQVDQLIKEKKYQQVIDLLTDDLLEQQKNAKLYARKARVYDLLKKPTETLNYAQKAIDANPNLAWAYLLRGNALDEKKEIDKAFEDYNKAIELQNNYATAYNNRGIIFYEKQDYDRAIEDYDKAIELDAKFSMPYYNKAIIYKAKGSLQLAIENYEKYISLAEDESDYFYIVAKSEIEELQKNIELNWRAEISDIIDNIKGILLFDKPCITHYTTFSAANAMILKNSPFRLSEGTYLNDTSEGRQLLDHLSLKITQNTKHDPAEDFTEKPFIGSFVNEVKHNDLTLWRMYGKELDAEASGCALTINRQQFIKNFEDTLTPGESSQLSATTESRYSFYKIAYIHNGEFIIPRTDDDDLEKNERDTRDLNKFLGDLKEKIENLDSKQRVDIANLINDIVYLFKNAEYQYENEVRLVVDGLGMEKKFDERRKDDKILPPKVYIDMIDIVPVLSKITLGPKVERADEWASVLNYHLKQKCKKDDVKVVISHLPFK